MMINYDKRILFFLYFYILHYYQKPGFLQIIKAETLNSSFRNPFFLSLLRMVYNISIGAIRCSNRP